jgi:hypothetical protein
MADFASENPADFIGIRILPHEAAVARDIRRENGRHSPFDASFGHWSLQPTGRSDKVILPLW